MPWRGHAGEAGNIDKSRAESCGAVAGFSMDQSDKAGLHNLAFNPDHP